jgi:septal ring factor EnvC (AmiA/AmiB activator)
MTRSRLPLFLSLLALIAGGSLVLGVSATGQRAVPFSSAEETRAAMQRALKEAKEAEARGLKLEAQAREATEALEKTATEAAALAARIQEAEAGIAAAEARIALIDGERAALDRKLSARRGPLVRLTGALQNMARRPLALSALKPGSLRETVYLRAVLESTIPQIRDRTAALRAEIDRSKALEAEARQALAALEEQETTLASRRQRLAALETQQRLVARQANSEAARESERALALAEEARDLDALVGQLGQVGSLRKQLAALPGPIMRPARPGETLPQSAQDRAESSEAGEVLQIQLPVTGRTISGFGDVSETGLRSRGLTLSPRPGAQVVAPAEGRVAFAGPYRGYDRIVIIEHADGWTSLVTGLARTDVEVGDQLVGGSPLGLAGVEGPLVMLELRRNGTPVNPLRFVR